VIFIQLRFRLRTIFADSSNVSVISLPIFYCIVLNSDCWKATDDFHGFGGAPLDLSTLSKCQAACIDDESCVAIDWEPSNAGETCWILKSTVIRTTLNRGVITHYELNRTCTGKFCFYYTQRAPGFIVLLSIEITNLAVCHLIVELV